MIILRLIFFVIAVFFGLSVLLGALFLRGGRTASKGYTPRDKAGDVIEGEYTVVKEEKSETR